jgi:hypothetical protein
MPKWFRALIRLLGRREGRQALSELLVSFQAAQEALDAGDVDRSLDLLDDGPAEALLTEVLLGTDEESER